MRLDNLEPWQQEDIDIRLECGEGEIVEIPYKAIEVQEVEGEPDENGDTPIIEKKVVVDRVNRYYVGEMGPDETAEIISVLAVVLTNGVNAKKLFNVKHNIPFIEAMNGTQLTLLISAILGEDAQWVKRYWKLPWVIKVVTAWWKHNDFFGLMRDLVEMAQNSGLTEDRARDLMLGDLARKG